MRSRLTILAEVATVAALMVAVMTFLKWDEKAPWGEGNAPSNPEQAQLTVAVPTLVERMQIFGSDQDFGRLLLWGIGLYILLGALALIVSGDYGGAARAGLWLLLALAATAAWLWLFWGSLNVLGIILLGIGLVIVGIACLTYLDI
ncbi:hypothetical protein LDL08_11585 [Nonomuraea glycinis]|uniref:Uncharacterized protein n=1 Tax=Nonomuraea glycinis TaxID=2047744 RepID=A0A918A1I6_9ACTN|nr:hypothetical protein [Nonomuraea glycinis]MCA2176827.1 hypothetical protein [Nonomuraea glycinis]GGP03233.1 hypothetical protein GCM10012278_13630 [Nonomuraea glycinis]